MQIGMQVNYGDIGQALDPRSRPPSAPLTVQQEIAWREAKLSWYDGQIANITKERDALAQEIARFKAQLPPPVEEVVAKVPVKKTANVSKSDHKTTDS